MIEGESSRTAERMALERAAHQVADSPVVFADPLAIGMLRPEQAALLREHPERFHGSPIAKRRRAIVVVRSRIAEDEIARAADRGVTQYVVLGAGLDTFAYRNPHASVRVFEVDQPSTQRLKHERLATAGIAVPDNLTWVPFDFTRQTLPDALAAAGFDRTKPAVFAWLGVVMYLERLDAIETLRYISTLPTGTAVVFDYALPPEVTPWGPLFLSTHAEGLCPARGAVDLVLHAHPVTGGTVAAGLHGHRGSRRRRCQPPLSGFSLEWTHGQRVRPHRDRAANVIRQA